MLPSPQLPIFFPGIRLKNRFAFSKEVGNLGQIPYFFFTGGGKSNDGECPHTP